MNKKPCQHPDCQSNIAGINEPKNAQYECRICEPKQAFCVEHITNHEHIHKDFNPDCDLWLNPHSDPRDVDPYDM